MDSPGFRRREALLPNLYRPGQAHPVDGGFRLPCPRIPPNRLIAAALSHLVQLLISWAGTRIDPRRRRLPADPMQPARYGGSPVGMMGLLQPGVPGFHALRGVVCIYIMRQIYILFHQIRCCIQQPDYLSQLNCNFTQK